MTVRAGGAGEGGWLKRSADGGSEALDCEFVVVDTEYAKRKIWMLLTLNGTTDGHAEAGKSRARCYEPSSSLPLASSRMT